MIWAWILAKPCVEHKVPVESLSGPSNGVADWAFIAAMFCVVVAGVVIRVWEPKK